MTGSARFSLLVLTAAQFIVVLDVTIVGVALPAIQSGVGLGSGQLRLLTSGYALAFVCLVLLGGRLSDTIGRRRAFVSGLGLFTLASLACGLAPDGDVLVAARIAQGLGGALTMPAALGILTAIFPDGPARHRALGAWGSVGGVAAASGVLLGGLLAGSIGWEWVFFVNVPVGAAAVAAAPLALPASRPERRRRLDLPGAAMVTSGLGLLTHGLGSLGGAEVLAPRALGPLVAGIVLLALFAAWERRAADPLLPARLVRRRTIAGANVAGAAHGAMMLGVILLASLYAQQVLGYSPLATGVILLALRLTSSATASLAGRVAAHVGARLLIVAGLGLMTLGLGLLAARDGEPSLGVGLLLPLVVAGAGVGLAFVAVKAAALRCVPGEDGSVASGLFVTSQWLGYALAIAVVSAVGLMPAPGMSDVTLAAGLRGGFAICAAFGLAGIAATLLLVEGRRAWARACPVEA